MSSNKGSQKKKTNLEIIDENLPLIISQYPLEKVEQAKKKLQKSIEVGKKRRGESEVRKFNEYLKSGRRTY